MNTITDRQIQVLNLLSRGKTYPQISRALGVSESTVSAHQRHLYANLQAVCAPHAVRRGFELGLLGADSEKAPVDRVSVGRIAALEAELARVYAALTKANADLAEAQDELREHRQPSAYVHEFSAYLNSQIREAA